MKQLDNFINNTNLINVFLISLVTTTLTGYLIFNSLNFLLGANKISAKDCLLMCSFIGLVFSLYSTFLISISRQSAKFWNQAKIVKDMAEQEETKSGLELIYDNEFQALKKLSSGRPPHTKELIEIYYILTTKHKYIDKP